ncbi:MAG: zinc-ribbon domain-containing protein, partial [Candidatus Devosia euplotis]|nr:zinc-ribbon domain-containing protein [Candidatus Devosia euplotis]
MKLFACDHCGNTVYFENASCGHCGHTLRCRPDKIVLVSLIQEGGTWPSSTFPDEPYVFCQNARHGA